MDTIAVYSLMDKQAQENHIQWLVMAQTRYMIFITKGIVPISCEEIFTRIAKNDKVDKDYEVHVSMMEIYNERVQDLLIPIAKRPKEGHKIR